MLLSIFCVLIVFGIALSLLSLQYRKFLCQCSHASDLHESWSCYCLLLYAIATWKSLIAAYAYKLSIVGCTIEYKNLRRDVVFTFGYVACFRNSTCLNCSSKASLAVFASISPKNNIALSWIFSYRRLRWIISWLHDANKQHLRHTIRTTHH